MEALARQPQRIPGSRLPAPRAAVLIRITAAFAGAGALTCLLAAVSLMLLADPGKPTNQIFFYCLVLAGAAQMGWAAAYRIQRERLSAGAGADVGRICFKWTAIAAAIAAAWLAGLRLGAPVPVLSLATAIAVPVLAISARWLQGRL